MRGEIADECAVQLRGMGWCCPIRGTRMELSRR